MYIFSAGTTWSETNNLLNMNKDPITIVTPNMILLEITENYLLPEFLDRGLGKVPFVLGVVEQVHVVDSHVVRGPVAELGVPPSVWKTGGSDRVCDAKKSGGLLKAGFSRGKGPLVALLVQPSSQCLWDL